MSRRFWTIALLAILLLTACKGTKRAAQYEELYRQRPVTVYVAPLNDLSMHRAVRETADSIYNASLNIAAMQLYLTAADPLTNKGYYVPGPLASAQIAATETRSGKQLRNESINDLRDELGIDAVLFIDLLDWKATSNSWSVEAEYMMRSTHTNSEILHIHVKATKILPTDFKGNPKPLKDDIAFAEQYGCDLETAQRCRLVEVMNQFVLKDLPSGKRARVHESEQYLTPHPEYYNLRIHRDGSVETLKDEEL
jgi:hypothetical protein